MKVVQLNATAIGGGAARSAVRIHSAINAWGAETACESIFLDASTRHQQASNDHLSFERRALREYLHPRLSQLRYSKRIPIDSGLHSVAWLATGIGKDLNKNFSIKKFDILNLHWLGNNSLSIEELGKLKCPVAWTLHDQWAFSGAEHYSSCNNQQLIPINHEPFASGYSHCSPGLRHQNYDLNRATWLRKLYSWKTPISIICPSKWLYECVSQSELMSEWPRIHIPNPLDLELWKPAPSQWARDLLGLPQSVPLILFGAMGGSSDPRKGADLLIAALRKCHSNFNLECNPELVIFGESAPVEPLNVGFPVHYLGSLNDSLSLRLAYSAANIMVVPSRIDAQPNTATEALACGTPVLAFRTSGIPELVDDERTGKLAEPFDIDSLASSLRWLLSDESRLNQLSLNARSRALRLWSYERIGKMYIEYYQQILSH